MKTALNMTKALLERVMRHELLMRSGAVAFAGVFAIGPLVLLFLGLFSSLDWDLSHELKMEVDRLFGSVGVTLMEQIASTETPALSSLGWSTLAVFLFSAAAIFGQIRDTLSCIFGLPLEPQISTVRSEIDFFFRSKLVSILVVVLFILVSVASLIVSSSISFVLDGPRRLLGGFLDDFLTFVGFGGFFTLVFYYSARRRLDWTSSLISGVVTSILFTIGKRGISIYLSQSSISTVYGAAGSLAGILVWMYYSSLILFLGAELAALISTSRLKTNTPRAS